MKTLTVSEIMSLRPCAAYPETRVRELWGDRESLSLVEILRLGIPAEDRLWVLTRDGVCDRDVLRRWADAIADRVVRDYCLTCGVPAVEYVHAGPGLRRDHRRVEGSGGVIRPGAGAGLAEGNAPGRTKSIGRGSETAVCRGR